MCKLIYQLFFKSNQDSGDRLVLLVYDADQIYLDYVEVLFHSPVAYLVSACMDSYEELPTQPIMNDNGRYGTWFFTKTDTSLLISSGGVVVLEYAFTSTGKFDEGPSLKGQA